MTAIEMITEAMDARPVVEPVRRTLSIVVASDGSEASAAATTVAILETEGRAG